MCETRWNESKFCLERRCQDCPAYFDLIQGGGRSPVYCPDCRKRRKREAMNRANDRRRPNSYAAQARKWES